MAQQWKTALIVGASSGIGECLARQLGAEGCRVALVARREAELNRVAEAIEAAGGRALTYAHDVREYECVPALFQQITHDLGGLDLFVYASGVMPRVGADEYDFGKDQQTLETNLLGAFAWCNPVAERFARAGSGTLVGISSVAGDRGRRGNPAYSASKAAFSTYLESLRNRVGRLGVKVVTVKPGPVATPMTAGLKMPLMIPAEQAATQILAAARAGKGTVYVPGAWRPIMFIVRHIPSFVFKKMNF